MESQQAPEIKPSFVCCRASVADGGQTSNQHVNSMSRFLWDGGPGMGVCVNPCHARHVYVIKQVPNLSKCY